VTSNVRVANLFVTEAACARYHGNRYWWRPVC